MNHERIRPAPLTARRPVRDGLTRGVPIRGRRPVSMAAVRHGVIMRVGGRIDWVGVRVTGVLFHIRRTGRPAYWHHPCRHEEYEHQSANAHVRFTVFA
ncbi:MAG: hypothetical protein ACRD2A_23165 [Vicinamibacterales bacterium]